MEATIIIVAVAGALLFLAVRSLVKNRKNGCAGCPGCGGGRCGEETKPQT